MGGANESSACGTLGPQPNEAGDHRREEPANPAHLPEDRDSRQITQADPDQLVEAWKSSPGEMEASD